MKRYRMAIEHIHHELGGFGGEATVAPREDPAGDWVPAETCVKLLVAAEEVLAQFAAITRHQDDLLVHGQTFESAEKNWDEATLGQFIDFQPLIAAVAAARGTGCVDIRR